MENDAQHVVIAGAGIMGLAASLELVSAGFRVTVIERGRAMEQSSWAAAGMLAVDDPENAPQLHALSQFSRSLYPDFLEKVHALSGRTVALRTEATLQGVHADASLLLQAEVASVLPDLRMNSYRFQLLDEASLDPRDLCAALPVAARAAGVTLREETTVSRVTYADTAAAHTAGLRVELAGGETIPADQFLLAGGAWSGAVELPGAAAPPVAPRKGQMIEVTLDGPVLPLVIRTPELYLVPRGDGRVVIGATVEDAGFDRAIDLEAGERLWQSAAALWPPVLAGRITARWTGLRPGFAPEIDDALPVIGSMGAGLWTATGHFRNGILMAPGTARVLCERMTGQEPSIDLEPFAPARFSRKALHPSA